MEQRPGEPLVGITLAFIGRECDCVTRALTHSMIVRAGREAVLAEAKRLHRLADEEHRRAVEARDAPPPPNRAHAAADGRIPSQAPHLRVLDGGGALPRSGSSSRKERWYE